MKAFHTIQGEGYHQGKAAYFIRLGGCHVGCHWCDVKASWDASDHQPTPIKQMINAIPDHLKIVVVTGGEPFMWNMSPLTQALKSRDIKVHIETSGAYPNQWKLGLALLISQKKKITYGQSI